MDGFLAMFVAVGIDVDEEGRHCGYHRSMLRTGSAPILLEWGW